VSAKQGFEYESQGFFSKFKNKCYLCKRFIQQTIISEYKKNETFMYNSHQFVASDVGNASAQPTPTGQRDLTFEMRDGGGQHLLILFRKEGCVINGIHNKYKACARLLPQRRERSERMETSADINLTFCHTFGYWQRFCGLNV
jgi:hypothetical protein